MHVSSLRGNAGCPSQMFFEEINMAINSCSACASSNLATQYVEQQSDKLQDRLRGIDAKQPGRLAVALQGGGASINTLGEDVGTLINTSA